MMDRLTGGNVIVDGADAGVPVQLALWRDEDVALTTRSREIVVLVVIALGSLHIPGLMMMLIASCHFILPCVTDRQTSVQHQGEHSQSAVTLQSFFQCENSSHHSHCNHFSSARIIHITHIAIILQLKQAKYWTFYTMTQKGP